jgi:anti-sigma B factor antagonist
MGAQPARSRERNGFRIDTVPTDVGTRLELRGELDMATSPLLEELLNEAEVDGGNAIVVDLAGLSFMDSSGLHVFIRAARAAGDRGEPIRLLNCPDAVRKVFLITCMDHLLDG